MEPVIGALIIFFVIIIFVFFKTRGSPINLKEIEKMIEGGELDKAFNLLQKKLSPEKYTPDAHFLMAKIYLKQGRYDYAIMELKTIIKNNKYGTVASKKEIFDLLIDIYISLGRIEEVYKLLLNYENQFPDDYNVAYNIGRVLIQKGEYRQALEYFKKALKLKSTDPDAIAGVGICYYYLGEMEKAREWLDQAVKLNRRNTLAHYFLALTLHRKGLYDQAIMEYEQVLRDKKLKFKALYGIGRAYQQKDMYVRAAEFYEEALKLVEAEADKYKRDYARRLKILSQPLVLETRYNLADCYMEDKNYAGAMEQWQEIESVSPGYKDVRLKIQQNARYGKDRLQDFLIAKDFEFEKIVRFMIQHLDYVIKKLEIKNKEEVYAIGIPNAPDMEPVTTFIYLKRSFNPVGERDLDKAYKEMERLKLKKMLVISANGFTPNAIKFSMGKPIDLIGKNQTMRLLKKYEMRV